MNFMELFGKIYSRKAAVVILAIAAITYIAIQQAEEGKQIDKEMAKWAIIFIGVLGFIGAVAQAILDWRKPEEPAEIVKE